MNTDVILGISIFLCIWLCLWIAQFAYFNSMSTNEPKQEQPNNTTDNKPDQYDIKIDCFGDSGDAARYFTISYKSKNDSCYRLVKEWNYIMGWHEKLFTSYGVECVIKNPKEYIDTFTASQYDKLKAYRIQEEHNKQESKKELARLQSLLNEK